MPKGQDKIDIDDITGYNMFMNFSIHLDDKAVEDLDRLSRKTGRKRNALIRQAVELLLDSTRKKEWPRQVFALAGAVKDLVPFESYREELPPPDEDPFP